MNLKRCAIATISEISVRNRGSPPDKSTVGGGTGFFFRNVSIRLISSSEGSRMLFGLGAPAKQTGHFKSHLSVTSSTAMTVWETCLVHDSQLSGQDVAFCSDANTLRFFG